MWSKPTYVDLPDSPGENWVNGRVLENILVARALFPQFVGKYRPRCVIVVNAIQWAVRENEFTEIHGQSKVMEKS